MGAFRNGYDIIAGAVGGIIKEAAPWAEGGVDAILAYGGEKWANLKDCNDYDYLSTYLTNDFRVRRLVVDMTGAHAFCDRYGLECDARTLAAIVYSRPDLFGLEHGCFVAYGLSAYSFASDRDESVECLFAMAPTDGHQCENVTLPACGVRLECVSDFTHDMHADIEQLMLNVSDKPFEMEFRPDEVCSLYQLYDYIDNQYRCGVPLFAGSFESAIADHGGTMKTLAIGMMNTFAGLPAELSRTCPIDIAYKLTDDAGNGIDCLIGFEHDADMQRFSEATGLGICYAYRAGVADGSSAVRTGRI